MAKKEKIDLKPNDFVCSNWREIISSGSNHGYSSISSAFGRASSELERSEELSKAKIMGLFARTCSMMFDTRSINEPFKPVFQDFREGRRSAIPDDFTLEELTFFENILVEIDEPWLKARIADILWLCRKPKNPEHARMAVQAYISHPIVVKTWRIGIDKCWERASQICIQIRDYETLDEIETHLYSAFSIEHNDSPFMTLWLAELMDKLGLAKNQCSDIATKLFEKAQEYKSKSDYNCARSYLELASKKYKQSKDDQGWIGCFILIAECFELEADERSPNSQMVANSFYENAIQGYRRVPVKDRAAYGVDSKLKSLRQKLTKSGEGSLGEMGIIKTPGIDLKEMVENSQNHVAAKKTLEEALIFFSGLYSGPDYNSLKQNAENSISESPISSLFGSTHMSSDGRVVAKTPAMDLTNKDKTANNIVIKRQIQQHLMIDIQIVCNGQILPALNQILMEHRVTYNFIKALCYHSPFVPSNRESLTAKALLLGFEYDFANAIHLLCPQFENMIRAKLKENGAHTSNVDPNGIEHENGLSTLIDLPEANNIFGHNAIFEMKAIFTDAIGPNLRNEVAHGLLDDNSASGIGSIYGWWMILRMILRSLYGIGNGPQEKKEVKF